MSNYNYSESNFLQVMSNFLKIHKVGIGYFSFTFFCGIAYYIAYSTNYPMGLVGQYLFITWVVGMSGLFMRNTIREINNL